VQERESMVALPMFGTRVVTNTARACVKRNLDWDTDRAAMFNLKTDEYITRDDHLRLCQ
jgi:hypothetical protein